MEAMTKENPWKGLNFYREEDKNDFFGRSNDVERLSLYIINNSQTVLYGKSGIGKSSILNAGVFPVARKHGLFPVPIKFIHDGSKSYLQQVKDRINIIVERHGASIHELVTVIDKDAETLWEYLHRTIIYDSEGKRVRLLLVIDQFEEIFTLQQDDSIKEAFFAELADLLNDVVPLYIADIQNRHSQSIGGDADGLRVENNDSEIKIELSLEDINKHKYLEQSDFHIVLTLRDDFLGCLERYTANIPCMKTNRYALQPLTKAQAEEIIMFPREHLVATGVPELIIQKVTDNADNRLNGLSESSVDAAMLSLYLSRLYTKRKRDEEQITVELVRQFSDNIIKDFYEDAVKDIPNPIIERIEDELLTIDDRRNNVSIKDFVGMGIPEAVIRSLVNDKKLLRQFNYGGDIRVEYMHDVLCKVVSERIEQRELRKAQEREREMKKKNRRMSIGIIAFILFFLLSAFVVWDGLYHDVEVHYGMVIKRYGWFEGLERISKNEASYRDCHYVLKYHGRWTKHPYAMEARNGYGKLTAEHTMGAYILNQYDETDKGANTDMVEKLKTVCQWEFVPDQKGDFVVQERAMNQDGDVVFVYNRFVTDESSKIISTYTDEYGFPLMFRDSTYFYIRITYDNRGFETLMEFFDDKGCPITNQDSVYQTCEFFLDNGVECAQFSCFLDGQYTKDRFGNCGYVGRKFTEDSLRIIEYVYLDPYMNFCRSTADSIIVTRNKYDEHGRLIEQSYWDEFGNPDTCTNGYHINQLEYNRHGKLVRCIYLGLDSIRCTNNLYINGEPMQQYEYAADYDQWGNMILCKFVYKSMVYGTNWQYTEDGTVTKIEVYNICSNDSSSLSCDTVYTYRFYWDMENQRKTEIDEDYTIYMSLDDHGNPVSIEYYDTETDSLADNNDGWQINKMTYKYEGDTTYISDYCYNVKNEVVYHHEILVDSMNCAKTTLEYDNDGHFSSGYRCTYYGKDFKIKKTMESLNKEWNTIRTYENNLFYYRLNYLYSIKPSNKSEIGWFAENEFQKPAVVASRLSSSRYYAYYSYKGRDMYFNENGEKIDPYKYDNWLCLAYIELKQNDSVLGFKNGDIVIACDKWTMWFDKNVMAPYQVVPWWKDSERDFVVARLNKDKDNYDTIHIVVPANIDIDKYIEFNKCSCTYLEAKRVDELIDEYVRKKVAFATPENTTQIAYRSGIHDEIILLEYNEWNFLNCDITELQNIINSNRKKPKHIVYIDYQTDVVDELNTDTEVLGLLVETKPIQPAYYDDIQKRYKQWKKAHE